MEQLELDLVYPDEEFRAPSQVTNLEAKYTRDWFMYGRLFQRIEFEERRRNPERKLI